MHDHLGALAVDALFARTVEVKLLQLIGGAADAQEIAAREIDLDRMAVIDLGERARVIVEHDLLELDLDAVAQVDRRLALAGIAGGPGGIDLRPVLRAKLALIGPVGAVLRLGRFERGRGRLFLAPGLLGAARARGFLGAQGLLGAQLGQFFGDADRQVDFRIRFGLSGSRGRARPRRRLERGIGRRLFGRRPGRGSCIVRMRQRGDQAQGEQCDQVTHGVPDSGLTLCLSDPARLT